MTITVTKEHYNISSGYHSPNNCPLAVALKEKYGEDISISVGGMYVRLFNEKCNILNAEEFYEHVKLWEAGETDAPFNVELDKDLDESKKYFMHI